MSKTRVFIIEDEPTTALAIQRMLENFNQYNVIDICASGEDALDRIQELKPDVILMDITLKGDITGIEAAAIINKNSGPPIIYLTANTNYETIQLARDTTKSYGYLLKPVQGMDLHWTINTALKRHQLEESLR